MGHMVHYLGNLGMYLRTYMQAPAFNGISDFSCLLQSLEIHSLTVM